MATINVRAVVLRDGDAWVAQALEYDIGAQANDLKTLHRRFALTLKTELEESVRRTGTPFGGIEPAPEYFHRLWDGDSLNFVSSGSASAHPDGTLPVGYQMQLAA